MPSIIPSTQTTPLITPDNGLTTTGSPTGQVLNRSAKTDEKKPLAEVAATEQLSTDTRVSLSTDGTLPPAQGAVTYAEIWKDGIKIAVIDSAGGVSSQNPAVMSMEGAGGTNGIMLAARRAAQIMAAVGGQVMIGGQSMDTQTMTMRAKLQTAYGQAA